jgi:hypothetical protein
MTATTRSFSAPMISSTSASSDSKSSLNLRHLRVGVPPHNVLHPCDCPTAARAAPPLDLRVEEPFADAPIQTGAEVLFEHHDLERSAHDLHVVS